MKPLSAGPTDLSHWLEDHHPTAEELRQIHQEWVERFSPENVRQGVCASCGQLEDYNKFIHYRDHELPNIETLRTPFHFLPYLKRNHPDEWLNLWTYGSPHLDGHILSKDGLTYDDQEGNIYVHLCDSCNRHFVKGKIDSPPPSALAAGTYTGPVPHELASLTQAEQIVIGLNRVSQQAFFFLKSANRDPESRQRASKGHWIAWPQYVGTVVEPVLSVPLSPEVLASSLHISLVGPPPHSESALKRSFEVSVHRLREAWLWLRTHNPLYEFIYWDSNTAEQYNAGGIPSSVTRTLAPDGSKDALERSGYVPQNDDDQFFDDISIHSDEEDEEDYIQRRQGNPIVGSSGVIDKNGHGPNNRERRVAALRRLMPERRLPRFVRLSPALITFNSRT